MEDIRCFACGRVTKNPKLVQTMDEQQPYVGPDCYSKIKGDEGYQPPLGGPRIYWIGSKG